MSKQFLNSHKKKKKEVISSCGRLIIWRNQSTTHRCGTLRCTTKHTRQTEYTYTPDKWRTLILIMWRPTLSVPTPTICAIEITIFKLRPLQRVGFVLNFFALNCKCLWRKLMTDKNRNH